MDKKDWSWLPAAMPGVAKLVAEQRVQLGNEHVNRCWRRGLEGQPGWFFAREGAIAVGTPWNEPEMANFAAAQITSTQAMLMIRKPVSRGASDGTD